MNVDNLKYQSFKNNVLNNKKIIYELIKKTYVSHFYPILRIFDYSQPIFFEWNQKYRKIFYGAGRSLTQPERNESNLQLNIRLDNILGISKESLGIYLLKNETFFYVGKTDKKIEQRFHAHITKLTATNNKKHDHPQKWQEYAKFRYKTFGKDSINLKDIYISFFELSSFDNFLISENIDERLSEFESLIFYFMKTYNKDIFTLNSEVQIGKKPIKIWHLDMWVSFQNN